eukprot:c25740_g1_i1 orf=939-2018(+)
MIRHSMPPNSRAQRAEEAAESAISLRFGQPGSAKWKQLVPSADRRSSVSSPDRTSIKRTPGSPARQFRSGMRHPAEIPQQNVVQSSPGKVRNKNAFQESSPNSDQTVVQVNIPQKLEGKSLENTPRNLSDKIYKRRSRTVHRRTSSSESGTVISDYLTEEDVLSNPGNLDLGPLLLKLASALHLSGENPLKALECSTRAARFLERAAGGKPSLDLVMSLHLVAAIYCRLGRLEEAIPVLQRAVDIPNLEDGVEHSLAAFAGHMQLGDIFIVLGQQESALTSYHTAYDIQKNALGQMDPQVGETCSYLAEAHLQVCLHTPWSSRNRVAYSRVRPSVRIVFCEKVRCHPLGSLLVLLSFSL